MGSDEDNDRALPRRRQPGTGRHDLRAKPPRLDDAQAKARHVLPGLPGAMIHPQRQPTGNTGGGGSIGPRVSGAVRVGRLVGITLRLHRAPRFASRTVALGARAAEEFGHGRPGSAPALAGGDARGVEMIGDGLGRRHPRRLGGLDFDDEVPHERLDVLSPLRHSVNPSELILYVWQDNCTHPRVSASDSVTTPATSIAMYQFAGAVAERHESAYGY